MLYLNGSAVRSAMPSLDDQLALAARALRFAGGRAQVPGKSTIHPQAADSFAYAMPAYDPGTEDVNGALGIKWVTGYPANSARSLPAISSLVLLNDPVSGRPSAILDGGGLTAARTAAVSGVSIRLLLSKDVSGRAVTAAILGAGVQGHAHLGVLGHVLPGVRVLTFDRHSDRAAILAQSAHATPGISSAEPVATARDAVSQADLVITAASFGSTKQIMTSDWLRPDVLIVAVDYETYVSADVAKSASTFLIDEPEGYRNVTADGRFKGFREPDGTIGDVLEARIKPRPGQILVCHLGFGLTDVLFAQAIVERATNLGIGLQLPA